MAREGWSDGGIWANPAGERVQTWYRVNDKALRDGAIAPLVRRARRSKSRKARALGGAFLLEIEILPPENG